MPPVQGYPGGGQEPKYSKKLDRIEGDVTAARGAFGVALSYRLGEEADVCFGQQRPAGLGCPSAPECRSPRRREGPRRPHFFRDFEKRSSRFRPGLTRRPYSANCSPAGRSRCQQSPTPLPPRSPSWLLISKGQGLLR